MGGVPRGVRQDVPERGAQLQKRDQRPAGDYRRADEAAQAWRAWRARLKEDDTVNSRSVIIPKLLLNKINAGSRLCA